jgi:GntR family transcriptional regulator/MocR family aminotransferase
MFSLPLFAIWTAGNDQFEGVHVDQSGERGIARRIVAACKEQIHAGTYRAGDRLPSTRAFATEWGTSRTTVTAAYGQLIAEGYLITRPGVRAVVAEGLAAPTGQDAIPAAPEAPHALSAFARRLLACKPAPAATEGHRIADFRYGDLAAADFPVLAWRRAMNLTVLRRGNSLRYDDPQGSYVLRSALQGYLWRARGIRCTLEQIVIVNGSQQGLDLCARLLLDPGQAFVIENPGYVLARHAFLAAGGIAHAADVDSEGLITEGLPNARLAYVTPSHQYPLGAVLSATRRRALVAWAARTGAYVVEDDYDGEYRHAIAPIPPLQTLAPEAVVYVGTMSKTLSPTLRLGYLVVPEALSRVFTEAKRLTDRHTSLFGQDALSELLNNGVYERHVRVIRRRNTERRALMLTALTEELGPAATVSGADTGLHIVAWIKELRARHEMPLAQAARLAGVGLYPIGPLYDPALPRPDTAGFVLGYAALDAVVLRRGIQLLGSLVTEMCEPKARHTGA